MKRWAVVFGGLLLAAEASAAESPRRVAVLVGSNTAAAGRQNLKFSHRDVQGMTEVLVQAGGFKPSDVRTLLDPSRVDVLGALDDALALLRSTPGETMLLFYYSGHADDAAVYPNGSPLPIAELRDRLESDASTVRVEIIDACRGGGWTRAKGLHPEKPFAVDVPLMLSSEGSVLMASSSGLENAHETDALKGSFFTHYLVAALRGAADSSGDGVVSASEAFSYAKERTIRDTALQADVAQHPSFSVNLRGRADLPLTTMGESPSSVAVVEKKGPLQLIHAATGLKVLEIPEGKRTVKLAVAPGKYLLKRRDADAVYARELDVVPNQSITVSEDSLTLSGEAMLAMKGPSPGARTHDGFMLRLTSGPAYVALSSGGAVTGNPGMLVSFVLGGTVAENLILGVSSSGAYQATLEDTYMFNNVGPSLTYYFMPANIYISGTVAISSLFHGTMSGVAESSSFGLGGLFMVGKEWWVSENWGLGVASQVEFGTLLPFRDGRARTFGGGIVFSATYN